MELTFVGTSSGVPTKVRNVSGLALRKQTDKHWYLIDCGDSPTKYKWYRIKVEKNDPSRN